MQSVKVVRAASSSIITIDKSKFIAELIPITDEFDAKEKIKSIKLQHPKANHHCYAYILQSPTERVENQSDDGEPAKTAGYPILEQLRSAKLINCLLVVTRFFGGTLLGTGGLIRAYSDSARTVIEHSELFDAFLMQGYQLAVSYEQLRQVEYQLKQAGAEVVNTEYNEQIKLNFYCSPTVNIAELLSVVGFELDLIKLDKRYL